MAAGRSQDFQNHFLGTHFFNPPRYLKLLEVIPTKNTDPDVLAFIKKFGEDVLGKGVVEQRIRRILLPIESEPMVCWLRSRKC